MENNNELVPCSFISGYPKECCDKILNVPGSEACKPSGADASCGGPDKQFFSSNACQNSPNKVAADSLLQCGRKHGDCTNTAQIALSETCPDCTFPEKGSVPCFLHYSWGDWQIQNCSNGHYATWLDNPDSEFQENLAKWKATRQTNQERGNTIGGLPALSVTLGEGQNKKTVDAVMSIGHGVLDGRCGDVALLEHDGRYVINFQAGPRSWSLEIFEDASEYLGGKDNIGQTGCVRPQVMNMTSSQDDFNKIVQGNQQ